MTGPFEDPSVEPTGEVLRDLHRRMVRIRYVGQEAVAAGVCSALRDGDQISSTHRGHGHLVARGGDLNQMMAELMGKSTGYCNGKGGSMHICDLDLNMLGANGIVGAGAPIAVGAGFANRYRGTDAVSVVFFGDGSTNIGAFHEAANMAAALKLPVVFICENNEYAEYTRRDRTMAIDEVASRAVAYGMPSVVVDGMDAVAVRDAALRALQYRPDEEVEEWKALDAIERLEARIVQEQAMTKGDIEAVRVSLEEEVQEAVTFGESSPDPDPIELLDHVYSEPRSAGQ